MNRQEFLDKIKLSSNMKLEYTHEFDSKDEERFFHGLERVGRSGIIKKPEKIINFAKDFSRICFSRTEIISGDVIDIYIELSTAFFRNEIGMSIAYIGEVRNACGLIERFYMAEDGRIGKVNEPRGKGWLFDNNGWISYDIDDFLNYLLTKEYDYHIPISKNTYQKLCEAGWHEGRCIDISDIENYCKDIGINLTQQQKDFISEFAGIRSVNPDPYENEIGSFFIADDPDYDSWGFFFRPAYHNEKIINGNATIYVGMYDGANIRLAITPDGRLEKSVCVGYVGRIIMEGWEIIISYRR